MASSSTMPPSDPDSYSSDPSLPVHQSLADGNQVYLPQPDVAMSPVDFHPFLPGLDTYSQELAPIYLVCSPVLLEFSIYVTASVRFPNVLPTSKQLHTTAP